MCFDKKSKHVGVCDRSVCIVTCDCMQVIMGPTVYKTNNDAHLKPHALKNEVSEKFVKIPEIWLYRILVSLLAGLCYLNSLHGDFLHDDIFAIKNNGDVTGSRPILDLFYNDFWGKRMSDPTSHKSYRPLCILTFRINYWLGHGMPYYFHVVNLSLHVVATFLFALVCQYVVFLPPSCCLMAGALFAVHPIHTEAVSGIVGRADLLAAILFMSSLLLYVRCMDMRWLYNIVVPVVQSWSMFFASMICGTLAMLSKEQGVTVLGVCILYDVLIYSRRIVIYRFTGNTKYWYPIMPLVKRVSATTCMIILLLLGRVVMMKGELPNFGPDDNPASFSPSIVTRILTFSYLWFFNSWLLLSPCTLCYDWQVGSIPLLENIWDPRNMATAIFVFTLVLMIIKWCHTIKKSEDNVPDEMLCGLILFIIPFLPASNIFFRVGFVVAERVLYIPSTGYCVLVAYSVYRLQQTFSDHRPLITALFVSLLLVLSVKSFKQNQVWQTRMTLFKSGVQTLPQNSKTHYNFANYLNDLSRTEEAIKHYQISVRLNADCASAHNNLGTLLQNSTKAERHFREALRVAPRHKGALTNLGSLLYQRGETTVASQMIHQVVEMDPHYPEAVLTLAGIKSQEKKWEEAETYYRTALEDSPRSAEAVHQYAKHFDLKGDIENAIKYYKKSFQMDSRQTTAIVNAANALKQVGSIREAEEMLHKALSVHRDISALHMLGVIYQQQERVSESIDLFKEILQIDPENLDATVHYANAMSDAGKLQAAQSVLSNFIVKHPYNIDALMQIASILGRHGKHHEALQYLESALTQARNNGNKDLIQKLLYQKGNHYKDLNLLDEAFKFYNETVTMNPQQTQAHLNLGAIYHIHKNYKMARHHYTLVLQREPSNPIALQNFEKLKRAEMGQRAKTKT